MWWAAFFGVAFWRCLLALPFGVALPFPRAQLSITFLVLYQYFPTPESPFQGNATRVKRCSCKSFVSFTAYHSRATAQTRPKKRRCANARRKKKIGTQHNLPATTAALGVTLLLLRRVVATRRGRRRPLRRARVHHRAATTARALRSGALRARGHVLLLLAIAGTARLLRVTAVLLLLLLLTIAALGGKLKGDGWSGVRGGERR